MRDLWYLRLLYAYPRNFEAYPADIQLHMATEAGCGAGQTIPRLTSQGQKHRLSTESTSAAPVSRYLVSAHKLLPCNPVAAHFFGADLRSATHFETVNVDVMAGLWRLRLTSLNYHRKSSVRGLNSG